MNTAEHFSIFQPRQFGPVPIDRFGRPIQPPARPQDQARPPPDYNVQEKKKLVPQAKGETPSKKEMKRTREDEMDDAGLPYVPLRMIRGEHRQIEEEIANRILSDISEEGSMTGSMGSVEDLEAMFAPKKVGSTVVYCIQLETD
ncbi:hypothetical protein ANCCAN_11498 [Ancylostoma caninum]|uniref:Uncharacterized protein n=1 Tax=Ancylostoma caninum TaxID=29170 RepID=A0A368GDP5_ANCCA|nr:hypothetical protein ANCCAN_11498 [Ancylostoma caninum]